MLKFAKLVGLFSILFSLNAMAAIKTENVEYKLGSAVLEGYWAYDDAQGAAKKPLILIVHNWMGMGEYVQSRARELAAQGYVAFAVDIYGKAEKPKDASEAGKVAGKYKGDIKLLRERAKAAFDYAKKNSKVDATKIVAIGYCFGGTTALEMARSGLPLIGVASFHGGLSTPNPADAKNIKAKVLVLHGAIDPHVPVDEVNAFQKSMNDAKVDYQFIAYSGAVHAFTEKAAGNDITKGAAYNEAADRRSMQAFLGFMKELVPQK